MGKRLLIVSMSMGGGHARAGECVGAAVEELAPGWTTRRVDLRDYAAWWFRLGYVSGYLFMVRRLPWLWEFLFRHSPRGGGTLPRWLLRRALRRYERLVADLKPDVVLATQVTASEATDDLRRRGLYRGVAATVVTDFVAHRSFLARHIDRFFVADDELRERYVAAGLPADRVEATGVPIDPVFEQEFDAAALRAKHGIRAGVPAVLVMGGSLGMGSIAAAVRDLLATGRTMDLIVVTGHNRRLRRRLEALRPEGPVRLHVFGFVDFVAELMAAADLFVSKPGGLSMTEALTVGVPVLAVHPLAGQEAANARHLAARGVVRTLTAGESLAEAVVDLLADAAGRQRLVAAARAYAQRGTARRIARWLIELASQKAAACGSD